MGGNKSYLTGVQNEGGGSRPLLDNVQKRDAFFMASLRGQFFHTAPWIFNSRFQRNTLIAAVAKRLVLKLQPNASSFQVWGYIWVQVLSVWHWKEDIPGEELEDMFVATSSWQSWQPQLCAGQNCLAQDTLLVLLHGYLAYCTLHITHEIQCTSQTEHYTTL